MTKGGRVFVTAWGPSKHRGRRGTVVEVGKRRTTVKLDGPKPEVIKVDHCAFHAVTIHTDEKG